MVDVEPMPLEVLVGLVQLVKTGDGWPTKGSVVLLAGALRGGGWLTSDDVAEYVPRKGGTCRRLLSQLDDERVILRDAGTGGGAGQPRRWWVEVNPDWEQWRVAWRYPRRVIRQKVVLLREEAQKTDLERFIARSYGARYAEISARLWARDKARQEAAEAVLSRVPWARDNASGEGAYRAFSGGFRKNGAPLSRAQGTRDKRADPRRERGTSPVADAEDLSPPPRDHTAPPKREPSISIQRAHHIAARRAVCARALPGQGRKRPAVWGSSSVQLDQLVADHGIEAVKAACLEIEADAFQVPGFLAALADLLSTGTLPDVDQPARPALSPMQLDEQRRRLDQRIATYRAEGYDPPAELLAERDELGNDPGPGEYSEHMSDQPEGATA